MSIICMKCKGQNIHEVVEGSRRYYYCATCEELHERAINTQYGRDILVNTKEGLRHLSTEAAIKRGDRYLLLERRTYPFGLDFPGGHIEYGEQPQQTMEREVLEETGLRVLHSKLLFQGEIKGDKCRYGVDTHIMHFYECECEDKTPILNPESASLGWHTKEEMRDLPLVVAARYLFEHSIDI